MEEIIFKLIPVVLATYMISYVSSQKSFIIRVDTLKSGHSL